MPAEEGSGSFARSWSGTLEISPFPRSDLAQASAETCFCTLVTGLFKMS